MAQSFADDFEARVVGVNLNDYNEWWTRPAPGADYGVMRIDTHTDHAPGQVVDLSGPGEQFGTYWGDTLDTGDQSVSLLAFADEGDETPAVIGAGVLLRMQGSGNPNSPSCYRVSWTRETASAGDVLMIERLDAGVPIVLASKAFGVPADDPQHVVIRGQVVGDTITAYVDGVLELTATDSTYGMNTGHVGVWLSRRVSSGVRQPFFDDFQASIVVPQTGPQWTVWDGAQEIAADSVTVWNGSQEVVMDSSEVLQ